MNEQEPKEKPYDATADDGSPIFEYEEAEDIDFIDEGPVSSHRIVVTGTRLDGGKSEAVLHLAVIGGRPHYTVTRARKLGYVA